MFTTVFINQIMDTVFHGNSSVADFPVNYYVGLSTTAPTETGANITEPSSDVGYARILVDSLGVSQDGRVENKNIIDFGKATGEWGKVTHAVLFDGAGSGANMIWCSPLSAAQTISKDNTLIFNTGELYFVLENNQ